MLNFVTTFSPLASLKGPFLISFFFIYKNSVNVDFNLTYFSSKYLFSCQNQTIGVMCLVLFWAKFRPGLNILRILEF